MLLRVFKSQSLLLVQAILILLFIIMSLTRLIELWRDKVVFHESHQTTGTIPLLGSPPKGSVQTFIHCC